MRARHRNTAVVVRCKSKGHELLTVHPRHGRQVLVRRAPGRAGGNTKDSDAWERTGGGAEPEFETLPAIERQVDAAETGTVAGLVGESAWLFCRCGATRLGESDADRIGEAVFDWYEAAKHGPATRPITLTVQV